MTRMILPIWTVGERLAKARKATGLTQAQFAERIGIARSSVANYELDVTMPRRLVLNAWAHETGVPVEWLLGQEDHSVTARFILPGQVALPGLDCPRPLEDLGLAS